MPDIVNEVGGYSCIKLGKYSVMEMAEPTADTEDLNNGSLVVKLSGNWGSILLPGDAETEEQNEITADGVNLKADVLVLGHHGSITSGDEKFLCEVSPKYAIISVGYNNKYGHPSDIVLERLKEMGISVGNIYRTDNDGAVRIRFGNRLFGKGFTRLWHKRLKIA